jgi:histidine ammonia-lyase
MGANAATQCYQVVNNLEKVLAIELMTAAQALDFRRPAQSSPALEQLLQAFREKVAFNEKDRILHNDMMKAVDFVESWKF